MITTVAETLIKGLADELEVPPSRYESTERSYQSLLRWLERPASHFHDVETKVYVQGSFRLGTAIRPVDDIEHYDLDVVCEFAISKADNTQKELQRKLGDEMVAYAEKHRMDDPKLSDRCWTLNYADEVQFHMDVLPCVPDGTRQRQLREQRAIAVDFVEQSVAITDTQHHNYAIRSEDWPVSNPNGYAEWFYQRMKSAFDQRRRAVALLEKRADVADIPMFRVKTPLQSAIQILKRHRDVRFSDEPHLRPSSIIITTLAAHSYGQEAEISGALMSILDRMDRYIERRDGQWWIANPSDPRENFADSWNTEAKRQEAFSDWLELPAPTSGSPPISRTSPVS